MRRHVWKSWSKVVTARSQTGSAVTSRRSSTRLEKYDQRVIRVDVEVSKEANPRLSGQQVRVEITIRSKGPVIRAEAAAEDKMSALDKAVERLERPGAQGLRPPARPPRARTPTSLAQAMAAVTTTASTWPPTTPTTRGRLERKAGPISVMGDGPLVVREKSHPALR